MSVAQWNEVVDSRELQRKKKKRAVLEAGASLFNRNGFERTSLEDIAASLGITKRTIYYYVQSKEEILMECIRESMEHLDQLVDETNAISKSPKDVLEKTIFEYTKWISTDFGACLVLTREYMLTDELSSALRSCKYKLDHGIRNVVRNAIDAGIIEDDYDPRLVSAAIFGSLNWIPFWNRSEDPVEVDKIIEQFAKLFVSGLYKSKV